MGTKQSAEGIDVLSVGLVVGDVFGRPIDAPPDWGRLGTFPHIEHHVGGCAANTAVDLVRLGLQVAVVGAIGEDGAGVFVRQKLANDGVNTDGIIANSGVATAYTFIMIGSDGQRRYLHHVGANASLTDSDVPDDLLARARYLHIGGSFLMPAIDGAPTARLLQRAHTLGVKTCLDTAYNGNVDARTLILPCLEQLDVFLPSVEEAELITGETRPESMLEALGVYEIPVVGIKLGAEGCLIRTAEGTERYPAYSVDVVDSSGAGDAFMAGFLYGMIQEWPIEQIALFANATAGFCVRSVGCSTGIPPAEDVLHFMHENR